MFTVQLQVRANHTAGPEPEWDHAAKAIAQAIRDLGTLHFSVSTGNEFGGCVLTIKQVEIDTATEDA